MTIPVVFIHQGAQDYLRIAIEQAQRYANYVVLLGDEDNKHLDVEHYPYEDYWQGADLFERLYKHMSGNYADFELFCFQRYFVVRNLALDKGWDRVFVLDSDVMLYCNVAEEEPGDYDLAISWCANQWEYRWSAAQHNSFWKTKTLIEMCDFLMETYGGGGSMAKLEEKWAWHQASNTPGGVCDMALLWLFKEGKKAVNLAEVRDGAVWDDNINQSENYLPGEYITALRGGKAIFKSSLHDYQPYGMRRPNERVWFKSLHFQGQAKGLMGEYATR